MLTPAQQQAVAAEGNVLVMAGAGTGKTRTLVERCVNRVMSGACSLDEILMVTFTEAAAAEMRQRIRARLEEELRRAPEDERLDEQLALLELAHISTLHSFCLRLVREHFYELEIDPQVAVLDEDEACLLANETLDELLRHCYAGGDAFTEAVQNLIQEQGRGWDKPIGELVLKLFHFTQTQPQPDGWLRGQLAAFEKPEPGEWRHWLGETLLDWRAQWLPVLRAQPIENANAHRCAAALEKISAPMTRAETAEVLNEISECDAEWPNRKKILLRESIKNLFNEADFLRSLVASTPTQTTEGRSSGSISAADPLAEDWSWVRGPMATLVRLAQEFAQRFAAAKRDLGAIDFHDLEQFALRLLCDEATGGPTTLARQWRQKLRFVFVDEYQDFNAAQDAILTALGREGAAANRFLVGDVKQSIYRFRLADPRIFQSYARSWSAPGSTASVIPLNENFRSREVILNFINSLFAALMGEGIGGVNYDEAARLQFGNAVERRSLADPGTAPPRIELHCLIKSRGEAESAPARESEESATTVEVAAAEAEARFAASRLRELEAERHLVWSETNQALRPVEWRDMVVLLRAPAAKAEIYAKEFARVGVPLRVPRAGLYDRTEITDLLSLLTLLDNPLQDVPTLAVLRSPLVGLSLDELAVIRLIRREETFWQAVQKFHRSANQPQFLSQIAGEAAPETRSLVQELSVKLWPKIDAFVQQFSRWRQLARRGSLSHSLEAVLLDTHYEAWLLAQPPGAHLRANVERLLALTRRFDRFHRHGLFRFLRFVEAQREAEIDQGPAATAAENAVRVMSIHQSKGLEFPVVVVADLGKKFNFSDLSGKIILDEKYGLCPQIKPPGTEQRYPSLPHWLASRRQKRETLGEELRLLYVALTRARDTLILTGGASRKQVEERWGQRGALDISHSEVLAANSFLDWLALWFSRDASFGNGASEGQINEARWRLVEAEETLSSYIVSTATADEPPSQSQSVSAHALEELRARMLWRYPFPAATTEAAKTSVSALRRRFVEETDEESKPARFLGASRIASRAGPSGKLSAAEIGTAHHAFLQFVKLGREESPEFFLREAERLERAGVLSAAEKTVLELGAIASFWQSEIGRIIREHASEVRRELEFTARLESARLAQCRLLADEDRLRGEFVVVQGVVDLAVIRPQEIWLLDFKTDHITESNAVEKIASYRPQLALYAQALAQIYRRPVTEKWLHFLGLRKTISCI